MKRLSLFTMIILFFGVLFSCQQIFTYSPLSWAQRDPANLPDAQKIAYAEEALASGDPAAVEAAYDALKDSTDPDTQALVSQLAVSASGLDDAIAEAVATMTFDPAVINTIDGTWLDDAETAMLAADTGGADITPEEYLTVAAAIIVIDAQDNHGNDITAVDLTSPTAPYDQNSANPAERALYYGTQAGYTQADIEDMFSL